MSTFRVTRVYAESKGSDGWVYTLKELETFIAECRAAGLADTARTIRVDTVGQLQASFNDSAG